MTTVATAAERARQALATRARAFAASKGCSTGAAYESIRHTDEGRALLSIAFDPRADRSVTSYLRALRNAQAWERWAAAMRWLGSGQ
jgi:hypothetical protein